MTDARLTHDLVDRSGNICELCGAHHELAPFGVAPFEAESAKHAALLCAGCRTQISGEDAELDPTHWFCLQEAIWSPVAPVQVLSYRLLHRLAPRATWAADLLAQAYLPDEVLSWAEEGIHTAEDDTPRTLDSNGTELNEGDSVTLIKDLDVKGTSFVAKRGTLVKGIHLTDNPEHVEGRVNGTVIVLKTMFLKRA
ncbi:PhnA domain protein [Lujinxingia vulgaris]|uniref:PhnA domain protein n=1 Tax=Lujinxingia vulgaris TaxID=2600176 RepID=A0A5C6XDM1_9DELT|nr:alkylphosphonate utilization protein [Lujinxingia vulgaris]TXD36202.1 PhnA domain protein [Lujinxingia vulgaris]